MTFLLTFYLFIFRERNLFIKIKDYNEGNDNINSQLLQTEKMIELLISNVYIYSWWLHIYISRANDAQTLMRMIIYFFGDIITTTFFELVKSHKHIN